MKTYYMSDVHLEFGPLHLDRFEGTKDDVVILAGDIGVGEDPDTYIPFLRGLAKRVRAILYIPGNHEFYNGNVVMTYNRMLLKIAAHPDLKNVHFGNRMLRQFGDVAFIGATLWTNMANDDWIVKNRCRDAMNDFHIIKITDPVTYNERKFHPDDTVRIFNEDYQFIRDNIKLARADGVKKVVVFTHHGCTEQASLPQYKNNAINPAFITNLEEEILAWQPNYWIHGHIHNTARVEIDQTVVLTNPRGYKGHALNREFDINAFVEL
jgi:hypothetical protein